MIFNERNLNIIKMGKNKGKTVLIIFLSASFILNGCSESTTGNATKESEEVTTPSSTVKENVELKDTLLTIVSDVELTSDQEDLLSRIKSRKTSEEVLIGQLTDSPQRLLEEGSSLGLPVSDLQIYVAEKERVAKRESGNISWSGNLKTEFGKVTLVLSDKGVTGTLWDWSDSVLYKFEPIGDGLLAVIKVDDAEYGED